MVEAIYFALTDAEASVPGRRGERVPPKCGVQIDEIATHGPSPKALAAVIEAAGRIDLYPDWTAKRLREAIGEKYSFDPDNVVCGSGDTEVISTVIRAFAKPDESVLMDVGADPILTHRADPNLTQGGALRFE